MAKQTKQARRGADVPLSEELLDRGIDLLEGPLNRVLERVLKSRVVLLPIGFSVMVTTKALGFVMHGPHRKERR